MRRPPARESLVMFRPVVHQRRRRGLTLPSRERYPGRVADRHVEAPTPIPPKNSLECRRPVQRRRAGKPRCRLRRCGLRVVRAAPHNGVAPPKVLIKGRGRRARLERQARPGQLDADRIRIDTEHATGQHHAPQPHTTRRRLQPSQGVAHTARDKPLVYRFDNGFNRSREKLSAAHGWVQHREVQHVGQQAPRARPRQSNVLFDSGVHSLKMLVQRRLDSFGHNLLHDRIGCVEAARGFSPGS